MFELVPSKMMRDYYDEIGFTFTDFQKTTLIWNAPNQSWDSILNALRDLQEPTKDMNLKKQIQQRLDYEEKVFKQFLDNSSNQYVYVVEDYEGFSQGFFSSYERALKYAKKMMKENEEVYWNIQKQKIISCTADETVRVVCHSRENINEVSYEAYSGFESARVTLNKNGEIQRFTSYELDEVEVNAFNEGRFESAFINVPFNLKKGTIVKNVVNDTLYILETGQKEWNKFLQRIKKNHLVVDFSDVSVVVYKLTESGMWSHDHIHPMYLEVASLAANAEQKAFICAMDAMSSYLSGNTNYGDLVLKYSKEYRQLHQKKSMWDKVIENAETVEDLMN